jgi:ribosome-associated toxin RatA of RatAB toxin-antitoxin module
MSSAVHSEIVAGTRADCFAAVIDFESYPDWQSVVQSVDVRSRDANGRGREVAFLIDLKLRRVNYALIYEYTEPGEVRWRYAGGDLRDVSGSYVFAETSTPGTVQARYALELDFGFPVPGPVRNRLQREVMRRSVRELKARVEAGRQ